MNYLFGTGTKQEMPVEDYAVTFFNFSTDILARYSGKLLESPFSVPIQIVDTASQLMSSRIIEASERKYSGHVLASSQAECLEAYQDVFSKSRTVVLADSFFVHEESFLHDTEDFHKKGGKDALVNFYNNGGTVVVFCEEGIYSIGSLLSQSFGCDWSLCGVDNETCVPTEQGKELLGDDIAKDVYARKGHFVTAPDGEGLYRVEILSFEKYATEHYGIDPEEEEDEEEMEDAKEAYERYKKINASKYLLALHQNENGGRLIWMGDRGQEDPKMRAIFAKLCHG